MADGYNSQPGPSDSYLGKYYCRLLIGEYKRTKPFSPQDWTPNQSTIFLPIPKELSDDTYAGYSEASIQGVGDIINGDLAGLAGRSVLNAVGPLAETGINKLTSFGGDLGTKLGEAAKNVSGISAESISSAVQSITGYAPNPNPTVLFTGPQLRDFNFSWTFYPKEARESEKIDKMIKILKRASLPSQTLNSTTGVLNFPSLCQINFFPWDSGGTANQWGWTNRSIIRIKKCFIKNVRVNYADFGNPAFFHGTSLPIMYRLNITLQETEYMLSKDWQDELTQINPSISDTVDAFTQSALEKIKPISGQFEINEDLLRGVATTVTGGGV